MTFFGFREMTCASCRKTSLYPMPKWMVRTYAVLLIIGVGAAVTNRTLFYLAPGDWWILLLAWELFENRSLWKKLRALAARAPGNPVPMERVAPGPPAAIL